MTWLPPVGLAALAADRPAQQEEAGHPVQLKEADRQVQIVHN